MLKIKKILAIVFVALLSYVDIGLLYNFNHGLHAHIVANNEILIHYHTTNGNSDTHHSNDCNPNAIGFTATFLTFLDNAQEIFIVEYFNTIHSATVCTDFVIPATKKINSCFLRAPPIA